MRSPLPAIGLVLLGLTSCGGSVTAPPPSTRPGADGSPRADALPGADALPNADAANAAAPIDAGPSAPRFHLGIAMDVVGANATTPQVFFRLRGVDLDKGAPLPPTTRMTARGGGETISLWRDSNDPGAFVAVGDAYASHWNFELISGDNVLDVSIDGPQLPSVTGRWEAGGFYVDWAPSAEADVARDVRIVQQAPPPQPSAPPLIWSRTGHDEGTAGPFGLDPYLVATYALTVSLARSGTLERASNRGPGSWAVDWTINVSEQAQWP